MSFSKCALGPSAVLNERKAKLSVNGTVAAYHTLKVLLRVETLSVSSELNECSEIKNRFQLLHCAAVHFFVKLYHKSASVMYIFLVLSRLTPK